MPESTFDPHAILRVLTKHDVDFVLIGGLAGSAHGSAFNTFDLDIAYDRSPENLERLAAALTELGATLRGAPQGLPFHPDAATLARGLNFTFSTPYGSLDILGEAAGAPRWNALERDALRLEVHGVRIRVASLDHLIAMKEAAGRSKDKAMAEEYRLISDELRGRREPGQE